MEQMSQTKEIRIRRANTDWWIHEKAIVADNGKTYIGYVTDMGEIHIKELDAKCSRAVSRDVRICDLNCNYADEHNAPSICILKSGKIIVAYTGHACDGTMRYRMTERPYDLDSFGEEKKIYFGGNVTYAQLSENTARGEVWLFTRFEGVNWTFLRSADEGETWSEPNVFLRSDAGGLFYFDIRKQQVAHAGEVKEQWFFALYGHPIRSADHTIHSGIFDAQGQLRTTGGKALELNLFENTGKSMDLNRLDVVYSAPEGETVRLLAVSPTMPLRVGFAPFRLCDKESAYYASATFVGGQWQVSEPICTAGEFLTEDMRDGSQSYLGGMAYYYGVGESGLEKIHPAVTCSNRIYIARFDGEARVLESYLSTDRGKTYVREEVIRRVPADKNIKLWRPTVPIHAQDNMPVYWHEGIYTAHTGGWHADVVAYVSYDD